MKQPFVPLYEMCLCLGLEGGKELERQMYMESEPMGLSHFISPTTQFRVKLTPKDIKVCDSCLHIEKQN